MLTRIISHFYLNITNSKKMAIEEHWNGKKKLLKPRCMIILEAGS
jgi:hypothetical protein